MRSSVTLIMSARNPPLWHIKAIQIIIPDCSPHVERKPSKTPTHPQKSSDQ